MNNPNILTHRSCSQSSTHSSKCSSSLNADSAKQLRSVRQVYKAKKGMQDVAVKTIHSRLVSPHVPVSEAADNIDRVSTPSSHLFC